MHALTLHVIEHRRIGFFRGATHQQDQKSVTSCQCSKLFDVAKRALGGISRDPQPDYEVRESFDLALKTRSVRSVIPFSFSAGSLRRLSLALCFRKPGAVLQKTLA